MSEQPKCELCGEPMPPGEEMFKFHGYSCECPKPPLPLPLTKKPDWRIGLSVKTRLHSHEYYYDPGKVIDVLPDGTNGLHDKDGILKIELASGKVILAKADDWITA